MKFAQPVEQAIKRARTKLLDRAREYDFFRKLTLYMIGRDTVWMTRAFPDHMLTFSPHEVVGKSIYRRGHHQRDLAERVLEIIGELLGSAGKTLLEIGANIGTHSVYLMLGGRFERIVCVEPEPRNLALLRRNLLINGLVNKATVVECAAGDHDGDVELFVDDVNHGATSLLKTTGTTHSIRVPLRRVDHILSDHDVDPSDIGLVWMDIEGAEPAALRSMEPITARQVPLAMEFSPALYGPQGTADLIDFLAARYPRCVSFAEHRETWTTPQQIPRTGIFDIVLLP